MCYIKRWRFFVLYEQRAVAMVTVSGDSTVCFVVTSIGVFLSVDHNLSHIRPMRKQTDSSFLPFSPLQWLVICNDQNTEGSGLCVCVCFALSRHCRYQREWCVLCARGVCVRACSCPLCVGLWRWTPSRRWGFN